MESSADLRNYLTELKTVVMVQSGMHCCPLLVVLGVHVLSPIVGLQVHWQKMKLLRPLLAENYTAPHSTGLNQHMRKLL